MRQGHSHLKVTVVLRISTLNVGNQDKEEHFLKALGTHTMCPLRLVHPLKCVLHRITETLTVNQ